MRSRLAVILAILLPACAQVDAPTAPVANARVPIMLPRADVWTGNNGQVAISGPSHIEYQGTYTWTVQAYQPYCTEVVIFNQSRTLLHTSFASSGQAANFTVALGANDNSTLNVRAYAYIGDPNGSSGCVGTYLQDAAYAAVGVDSPLYPPLSVGIDGGQADQTGIFLPGMEGSYTWTAYGSGGSGTYAYSWDIAYESDPFTYIHIGDSSTLTMNVTGCTGGFALRATVYSGGHTATGHTNQYINMMPC